MFIFLFTQCFALLVFAVVVANKKPIVNGRYTRSIEEFKLTVPRKLSTNGDFSTFDIPHFFTHNSEKRREKRTTDDPEMVRYAVNLDDMEYHVDLWPNHDFLSPETVFEMRQPKTKIQDRKLETLANRKLCHYTGKVRGHEDSRVALSTCDGLAGYVSIGKKRFFIEPVEDHTPNDEGHHLHVVYERHPPGATSEGTVRCGTSNNWKEAWKKRLRQRMNKPDNSNLEKRGSDSLHRYLETLVVCDKKFLNHHKHKDVETYVLTIMNMVADFYHDASSGNQMDVVVVRVMYLEKEEEEIDLMINRDADKTLESFCQWQRKVNAPVENPNHHDIAVLLTRYDICADEMTQCSLMGLAYVASACTEDEPCAINEDSGLVLGIVVAHEMGHVMGCSHDKEGESECAAQDTDESFFVMAPYVHLYTTRWSTCSRGFITALFENNLGDCLNDEPDTSLYKYPNALPGTVYDANQQCDFNFPGSKICSNPSDNFCEMLVCRVSPKECVANEEPPADGTKCGENKWCYRKKCVEIGERPEAVNGGWGSWNSWTPCSRTCGGGVSVSERECDNPVPANKGRYCIGDRKKYKVCNVDPCPEDTPNFRELQCTEHNNKPFQGEKHTWVPYIKEDEPCVLYCANEANSFAKLEPRVKDGTPCKPGTRYMCISGTCRKVGCDNQVDSDAVEDVCGICNGDGTQCKIVEEVYNDVGAVDYKKVATIPAGSRNLEIEELDSSMNTLAITDKSEKTFYLNGGHTEERDGSYQFGKVEGVYTHTEPGKEHLIVHGPLTEDLIFFVCFYTSENPGYRYKYAEPSPDNSYVPHYNWELLEWTECTARCDGGTQQSQYECVEEKGGKVSSNFCVGEEKPAPITKKCNEDPCKTKWKVGKWGDCHVCRDRSSGVRTRAVVCVKENPKPGEDDILVNDDACKGTKPGTQELCHTNKVCKDRRNVLDLPEEMLEDVWSQTRFTSKRNSNNHTKCPWDAMDYDFDSMVTQQTIHKEHLKNVGGVVKDRVPANEIKIIKVPIKQTHIAQNLSDNAYETMGDSTGDVLDTGHAVIATGEDAAKILKDLQKGKPDGKYFDDGDEEKARRRNKGRHHGRKGHRKHDKEEH